jgi:Asp-tRNA(Asn)/Glu-tRNA(Gln) amidotransferase A subunit family amidase
MSSADGLSRKEFVTSLLITLVGSATPSLASAKSAPAEITVEDLKTYEKIAGISFTDEERKSVLNDVRQARTSFDAVRELPIDFTTEPRYVFTPLGGGSPQKTRVSARVSAKAPNRAGLSDEDIAFLSVAELGLLIRNGHISSVELTKIYVERLKKYGDQLLCLVTLMEGPALRDAAEADAEIKAGRYRGPLHGIPCGVKDLFATKDAPTTWGANNFEGRMIDFDATVIEKLKKAGAIVVAKLSMGALAQGDVWFKGTTKNPWNQKQGSSGSSAGSSSATAAGLVAFAIGTETLGSIVSPSTRCRLFGLRPTYGRVSRYGGMALSYSMDKVGPICRYAQDTALVLAAICGADENDPSAVDRDFVYPPRVDFKKLKVGVLVQRANVEAKLKMDPFLEKIQSLGASLHPVAFSPAPNALYQVLDIEAGSAFDAFTRGDEVRKLKESAWPETFRASRYVTAVDYIQAQRARTLLMKQFEKEFGDLDMFVTSGGGYILAHVNWTGHPQIVIPQGDDGAGNSVARTLVGRLYDEARLVAVAAQCPAVDYHTTRPKL